MIIGVRGLTVATVSGGGEGSAVTYTGGQVMEDQMVSIDVTPERDEQTFAADDHTIEVVNGVNKVTVQAEIAKLTKEIRSTILGWKANSNDLTLTGGDPPYVGFGYVTWDKYKGTDTYYPYWIYKISFGLDNENSETRGESVNFQTRTLTGTSVAVQLEADGDFSYMTVGNSGSSADGFTTYTAALAWLKSKAGIT